MGAAAVLPESPGPGSARFSERLKRHRPVHMHEPWEDTGNVQTSEVFLSNCLPHSGQNPLSSAAPGFGALAVTRAEHAGQR